MVACVQTAPLPSDFYWREERDVCTQAILWGRQEITYEYYHEYWNYEYFPEDFCPGLYFYHHYFPSSHVCFFIFL